MTRTRRRSRRVDSGRWWPRSRSPPSCSPPRPRTSLAAPGSPDTRRKGSSDSSRRERAWRSRSSVRRRQGFFALTPFDAGYPRTLRDRLGDQAPPVLFTVGARELLSAESIGVVGSRAVSGEGEAIAREVGERVVRDGLALVSGGAKGVDRRAMSAAHEAGGRVVGYLAESLLRRVRGAERPPRPRRRDELLRDAVRSVRSVLGRPCDRPEQADLRERARHGGRGERARSRRHVGGRYRGTPARVRIRRRVGRSRRGTRQRAARGSRSDAGRGPLLVAPCAAERSGDAERDRATAPRSVAAPIRRPHRGSRYPRRVIVDEPIRGSFAYLEKARVVRPPGGRPAAAVHRSEAARHRRSPTSAGSWSRRPAPAPRRGPSPPARGGVRPPACSEAARSRSSRMRPSPARSSPR